MLPPMFNYTTIDESKVEYLDIAPASELPPGERRGRLERPAGAPQA